MRKSIGYMATVALALFGSVALATGYGVVSCGGVPRNISYTSGPQWIPFGFRHDTAAKKFHWELEFENDNVRFGSNCTCVWKGVTYPYQAHCPTVDYDELWNCYVADGDNYGQFMAPDYNNAQQSLDFSCSELIPPNTDGKAYFSLCIEPVGFPEDDDTLSGTCTASTVTNFPPLVWDVPCIFASFDTSLY